MSDDKYKLKPGRTSIADQAKARGVETPEGKTVAQIEALGFDVDPDWPRYAILRKADNCETGYGLFEPITHDTRIYALAT